jgi:ATP-dependent Clp protease ATP-binding subunit ClpA
MNLNKYTEKAQEAVVAAQQHAEKANHPQIEPEHLLLALAAGHADPAARALSEAGLDRAAIEQAIEQDLVAALAVVGVPASVVAATPPKPRRDRPAMSQPARDALEQSMQEAARRGERHIGSGHLLLGLLHPPAVGLGRVLAALGTDPARLADLVQVEMAAGR